MIHPPATSPHPVWAVGDRVVFKPMYGTGAATGRAPTVYEVRGVDGAAVWLRRPGGAGHITVGANWIVPATQENQA